MTGISVTSPEDKPTREQQIARLSGLIPADGVARLRIMVQMLDDGTKQYTQLRDAAWLIAIPKGTLRPDTIEALLDQLGSEIRGLAQINAGTEATSGD